MNRISVKGKGLINDSRLRSTVPLVIESAKTSESFESLELSLKPEADFSPSIEMMRVINSNGASNPVLVYMDNLPIRRGVQASKLRTDAPILVTPCGIEGEMQPLRLDFYRIEVQSGERMTFEVVAHRIGSMLDPVVRVLDPSGREVAFADDSPGLWRDCRMEVLFDQAGEYFVEIRDVEYEGGNDYFYYLRLGAFPDVTVCYPPVQSEFTADAPQFFGPTLDSLKYTLQTGDWNTESGSRLLSVSYQEPEGKDSIGRSFVKQFHSELPVLLEQEPNQEPAQAQSIKGSAILCGRLEANRDADYFRWDLKEHEQLRLNAQSRRWGASCDVYLELWDADGSVLKRAQVDGKETLLDYRADRAREVYLKVEELNYRGREDFIYVCEAQVLGQGGFRLTTQQDVILIPKGGEYELKVQCERWDYAGSIEVSWLVPEGQFEMVSSLIPEGAKEASIRFRSREDSEVGAFWSGKLIGKAVAADSSYSNLLDNTQAFESYFPRLLFPPREWIMQFGVAIVPTASKD